MENPNIKTTVTDSLTGGTYAVLAYRKLTPQEAIRCVDVATRPKGRSKKRNRAKAGEVMTIVTVIGANE